MTSLIQTLTISKSGHKNLKLESDYLDFYMKNFLEIVIYQYGLSKYIILDLIF